MNIADIKCRITLDWITELGSNEIFVFGSNASGRHTKYAAKDAMGWGAIMGQASGLQGRTFGVVTVNAKITNKVSFKKFASEVEKLYQCCIEHPELHFLITPVGCGSAGFRAKEVAHLFVKFLSLSNVSLPKIFIKPCLKLL